MADGGSFLFQGQWIKANSFRYSCTNMAIKTAPIAWVFQQFIFLLSLWEKITFCTWMISRSSLCHFNERQLGLLIRPIRLPYIYFNFFYTHACIFKASRTQICHWSVRCCVLISVCIDLSVYAASRPWQDGWKGCDGFYGIPIQRWYYWVFEKYGS